MHADLTPRRLARTVSVTIDEESSVGVGDGLLQAFEEELGRITQFYAKQVRAADTVL